MPWVLSKIAESVYAVPCESILSLFQLNKVTSVPGAPEEIKGVIKFQGKIIELLNINYMFNIKSSDEKINEFNELMDLRKEDHVQWVNELEKTVKENKEFTLETDPHQCEFGKWYDSYDSNNKNIMFILTFSKFDVPHKEIHELAIEVKELLYRKKKKEALNLINRIKEKELKQMISLFDELKEAYAESRKDIAVILGDEKKALAIAVEEIVAIEDLVDFSYGEEDNNIIKGIAKRKTGEPVFLLDEYKLIDSFSVKV